MASAPIIYFAGIATVVTALGVGFGSAMLFTSTTKPIQKEPASAFAKRDQAVVVETTRSAVPTVTAAVPAPAPVAASPQSDLIPAVPNAAERVIALDYAPPDPQLTRSAPMAAPAPGLQAAANRVAVSPKPIITPETTGSGNSSSAQKRKAPKVEKRKIPSETVNPVKKKTIVVERKRRPAPTIEDDDDDTPRLTFATERFRTQPRDFFGFLFGN